METSSLNDALQTGPTDAVTACLNPQGLRDHAADTFARRGNKGSLLMLELDAFEEIVGVWGAGAGDAALLHVADVVRTVIRGDDALARMSHSGFAVLLPGCTTYQTADISERIRANLAGAPLELGDIDIDMTVSVGVVQKFDDRPFEIDEWIPGAEVCLTQAKDQGCNRVVIAAAPSMN